MRTRFSVTLLEQGCKVARQERMSCTVYATGWSHQAGFTSDDSGKCFEAHAELQTCADAATMLGEAPLHYVAVAKQEKDDAVFVLNLVWQTFQCMGSGRVKKEGTSQRLWPLKLETDPSTTPMTTALNETWTIGICKRAKIQPPRT